MDCHKLSQCDIYNVQHEKDFLSDAQRIQWVKLLLDNGYADQVLLSQAVHTKHHLVRFTVL